MRVYDALKGRITSGTFRAGDRLDARDLGVELDASMTPIREALHRLAGERLVVVASHEGFHVPAYTEAELSDLYRWTGRVLTLALSGRDVGVAYGNRISRDSALIDETNADVVARTAGLFAAIAARSGNIEIECAIGSVNDRLNASRKVEAMLFADRENELNVMVAAFLDRAAGVLRKLITSYHRRRIAKVSNINRVLSARRLS